MIQGRIVRAIVLLAISVIFGIWMTSTPVFAFCPPTCIPSANYTSSITVSTDKSTYISGELISFSGHATNPYPGMDVTMKVIDPSGNVLTATQIALNNNGDFSSTLNTEPMTENGQYTLYVQLGDIQGTTAQTQFMLTGITTKASGNATVSNPNSGTMNAYQYYLQQHNNPNTSGSITVSTDKALYNQGDVITITSKITSFVPSQSAVIIRIVNPLNNLIKDDEVIPSSDGTSSTKVLATGPLWVQAGTYNVSVQYGSLVNNTTTFYFSGGNGQSNFGLNSTNPSMGGIYPPSYMSNQSSSLPSSSPPQTPPQMITHQNSTLSAPSIPSITSASKIPAWVKNIFIWYGRGSISDDELIGAIQFLVQQGIIKITP